MMRTWTPATLFLTLGTIWACGAVPSAQAQGARPHIARFATADSAVSPVSARVQLLAVLAEAAREPVIVRDTVASAVLAVLRRRTDSLPPDVTVTTDSVGQAISGYIDLSTDGSYAAEVRVRIAPRRSIVLGVITRQCGETCAREFELAMAWGPSQDDEARWTLHQLARREADGEPLLFVTSTAANESGSASADTRRADALTTVRGVVRDEKGHPLPGIEVFSADAAASVQTDSSGAYRMTLSMPPGGVLLSTRRIGWAPAFRTVLTTEGTTIEWNPTVKSTTVLARQLVTATGLPEQLRSFRYNDFVTRRARGVGQFFMTEEIWSAMSLGDVLNRANGVDVSFTYGSRIKRIRIPGCDAPQRVGVYIDGINETNATKPAEEVLPQFVNSAIVAMELYKSRGEIPGEFARPEYCAVIALWTR